jgi:hypothetical protein
VKFLNLNVVFGTYDLLSRYVMRLPISPCGELTEEEKGLFVPPHDVDGFRELALQTCGGSWCGLSSARETNRLRPRL